MEKGRGPGGPVAADMLALSPHGSRDNETVLAHHACQLIPDLKPSLVLIDEAHEINRSRVSHDQHT